MFGWISWILTFQAQGELVFRPLEEVAEEGGLAKATDRSGVDLMVTVDLELGGKNLDHWGQKLKTISLCSMVSLILGHLVFGCIVLAV